jgi:peptidoglycan/LPS O-acetylase OafA/YrhL
MKASLSNRLASKPHYQVLDGLRGVAALVVVLFHILEAHAGGSHIKQIINHGYLAVDFFFLLSGFVISYAYDNRWTQMTLKDFFLRRLIRLHPMIIAGSIIGAALFYYQASPALGWTNIEHTPVWKLLMVMLIGFTLIPVGKGLDIRGWSEMHPLNGPAWSLFFEYVANLLYALFLRRLPNLVLVLLMLVAGGFTVHHELTSANGDIIGGWTIDDPEQLKIGFTRLAFPFLAGLLLARFCKPRSLKNSFLITSVLLVILLAMPRLGGSSQLWLNGLYECVCIMLLFPLIIWLGASARDESQTSSKASAFLGALSYPVYITHYPFIYLYTAYVYNHNLGNNLTQALPAAGLTLLCILIVGYLTMKYFDQPVRAWLQRKLLS